MVCSGVQCRISGPELPHPLLYILVGADQLDASCGGSILKFIFDLFVFGSSGIHPLLKPVSST